jgi:hypothetical protein
MELRAHDDCASFGWSVGCVGRKPAQLRDDMRAIVDWAVRTWSSYFPIERGYQTAIASPAGPAHGVKLSVCRGDFRATVSIESIRQLKSRGPSQLGVRMFGRAESGQLADVERSSHRIVTHGRNLGLGVGIGVFALLCWWAIGITNPVYVLGGLLMVVAGLLTTTAGSTLGAWVGERIADQSRARARSDVARNHELKDDLRRWQSLARTLSTQRQALSGNTGRAPFRSLPAPTEHTGSSSIPTSFSFS